ncbi:TetR/AcrR family transcriptional regulator [Paenibacillus sp. FSL R5-0407]|uniref:TetR/AcrR family transcriptional regulator n=1 Tax=Paenibacillus sp. FSL R5-0407 TaxID=2975320 RepID=UPI0030F541B2
MNESMNGFEKRAQRIKEKILRATLNLLRTTDPKRIRIADISKAAKVSQVTIYNYFGSKEALLRDVFIGYIDKAIAEFIEFMDGKHTLKEKIEYIIFLEKEAYSDLPPGAIKDLVEDDPELGAYIEKVYQEFTTPLVTRIIEEGKASGEIAPDMPLENVMAFIQLYMNQYQAILNMAAQSPDRDKFLEGMVQMFFYGVCGKPE